MNSKILRGLFVNTLFFIVLVLLLLVNNQNFFIVVALVTVILWNSAYILKTLIPLSSHKNPEEKKIDSRYK